MIYQNSMLVQGKRLASMGAKLAAAPPYDYITVRVHHRTPMVHWRANTARRGLSKRTHTRTQTEHKQTRHTMYA